MEKEYTEWFEENHNKFDSEQINCIYNSLEMFSKEQFAILKNTKLKNPKISILLSVLLGVYGIDRMYMNEIIIGLIKMFTLGGFGIMYFTDIFTCKRRTYDYNYKSVMEIICPNEFINSHNKDNNEKEILREMMGSVKSLGKSVKNVQNTFYTK